MRLARWRVPDDPDVHEGLVVGSRVVDLPVGVGIQTLLETGLTSALELGTEVE